jgi:predicted amidohydrolase
VEATSPVKRTFRPLAVAAGAALLGVFLVLFVYAWRVPTPSSAPRPIDKARAIEAGQAVARASVGDPESAKFRFSFISRTWSVLTTCGEINYRTPTGGYGGFQRFVASGPVAQLEEQMSGEQFRQLWSVMCDRDE